jgi:hypothetical protein
MTCLPVRSDVSLPLLAGALCYALALAWGSITLNDPDTLWHIVAGRWILAHGTVPHADLFSHTLSGTPWVAHEWLAEPLMALLYSGFGWHGAVMMAALGAGLTMAFLTRALLRYLEPAPALVFAAAAWFLLLPHLLARPHILALPLMVLWMDRLVWARREGRAPGLAVALIMVPWANLHGSFLLGLGFSWFFMIEAVLAAPSGAPRWEAAKPWLLFFAAALAATLVNPNGIESYLLPWRLLHMDFVLSILVEWRSVDFHDLQPLEFWLLGTLGGILLLGIRLPPSRLLMVLLLFHMALQHARHGELLAFLAPLIAAPALAERFRRAAASGADRALARLTRPASARAIAAAGAVLAALSAVALAFPVAPNRTIMPTAALAAVRAAHVEGPVLNPDVFGGFLIFNGVPTFIDGRADMFGNDFIEGEYKAINLATGALPRLLDEHAIAWTIFPPKTPAIALLDILPGWRRLYADDVAVVHVRAERSVAQR